ncbi:hypothetical protein DFJ73DRAFT_804106 [Zopfochytrium polystomum]|nr:hypothetical protein DFJ73DRAFT_804106 [Zopfochytrium polystomum]
MKGITINADLRVIVVGGPALSPLPPSSSSSSYSTAAATATATRLTSAGAVVAAAAADSVISTNGGGTSRIMTVSLTQLLTNNGLGFSSRNPSFSTPSSLRSSPRISPMLAPSPMNATSAAASILHSSLNISTPPSPNLRPNPAHHRPQEQPFCPLLWLPARRPPPQQISCSIHFGEFLWCASVLLLGPPNPYAVQMFVGSSAAVDTEEYHSPSSMGGQPYSVSRLRRGSVGHHFASQSAPSSPDHAGFPSLSHNLPFPQPPQGVATPYSGQPPLLAHTASLRARGIARRLGGLRVPQAFSVCNPPPPPSPASTRPRSFRRPAHPGPRPAQNGQAAVERLARPVHAFLRPGFGVYTLCVCLGICVRLGLPAPLPHAGTPISTAARGRSPLPFRTTTAAAFADDADDSDVEVDKEHLAAPLSSRHFLFRQHQPSNKQQQQQQQPQGGKGVVKFLAAVVGGKRRKNAAAAAAAAIAVD